MTYVVLPNSGQSLGITRIPINTNFSLIQSVFSQNHVTFNNPGAGKHTIIQIPTAQSASPGTAAGEIALYTKTVTGNPELFWQPQSSAPASTDYQMTNTVILPKSFSATTTTGTATCLVTFLPGKMILISGIVISTSNPEKVTFPFNVSAMGGVVVSQNGAINGTFYASASTNTPASFTIQKSTTNASFNFTVMAQG